MYGCLREVCVCVCIASEYYIIYQYYNIRHKLILKFQNRLKDPYSGKVKNCNDKHRNKEKQKNYSDWYR